MIEVTEDFVTFEKTVTARTQEFVFKFRHEQNVGITLVETTGTFYMQH